MDRSLWVALALVASSCGPGEIGDANPKGGDGGGGGSSAGGGAGGGVAGMGPCPNILCENAQGEIVSGVCETGKVCPDGYTQLGGSGGYPSGGAGGTTSGGGGASTGGSSGTGGSKPDGGSDASSGGAGGSGGSTGGSGGSTGGSGGSTGGSGGSTGGSGAHGAKRHSVRDAQVLHFFGLSSS